MRVEPITSTNWLYNRKKKKIEREREREREGKMFNLTAFIQAGIPESSHLPNHKHQVGTHNFTVYSP